jgi:hypothetical protein
MITVRDLQLMLDHALTLNACTLDSEVRYMSREREDCSFEDGYHCIDSGFDQNGPPVDRRFGSGTFHLAQESVLQDAPDQLLISFDWG